MKVAHIHTNGEWGGGEYQVFHLLSGLTLSRVSPVLFTTPGGVLFERTKAAGLPVEELPLKGAISRLVSRGKDGSWDLLHLHDSKAASMGSAAGRRLGIPVVLSRRIMSPIRQNPLSRRKYSPRRLSGVIAISESVRGVFLECGFPEDRTFVVQSGLDIAALDAVGADYSLREKSDRPHLVGGIGKLSPKKNWQLMVRTAAHLADQTADIQWILVGDGPERENLERLVEDLGIQDRFLFTGFVPDAVGLLKAMDTLFFPSLMEGASVTVRQAMAVGVPVVAVDAPGTSESLAGHGWLVGGNDVEGAADSLLQSLLDSNRRHAVGLAAKEYARATYDMSRTVDGTIRVYEQILSMDR
ncbi:MAG: glycosyltransferase [Kiritimatiellia bacterium]|jgi:glycosyltransferase involved in cell wall biosynthesis|nr:glycosyltransferase [Kiritimatiellia bacterium]MDP6848968.1 glycosyltransferase [Kiritimatiellia bacterium]